MSVEAIEALVDGIANQIVPSVALAWLFARAAYAGLREVLGR